MPVDGHYTNADYFPDKTCGRCARRFTHEQFFKGGGTILDLKWCCGPCKLAWWHRVDACARISLEAEILHCRPRCRPGMSCWPCAVSRRVDALTLTAEKLNCPIWYGM